MSDQYPLRIKYVNGVKPTKATVYGENFDFKTEIGSICSTDIPPFSKAPWGLIKALVRKGLAENVFALGDEKTETGISLIDGKKIERTFRLVSFSHYSEDDIVIEQITDEGIRDPFWGDDMEPDISGCTNNYSLSLIRSVVSGVLNDAPYNHYYSKSLIKAVSVTDYKTIESGYVRTAKTLSDKVFIGAITEYYGYTNYGCQEEAGVIKEFGYYKAQNYTAARQKYDRNGNPVDYWLRSPRGGGNANDVVYIMANGGYESWEPSTSSNTAAFFIFTIGKD